MNLTDDVIWQFSSKDSPKLAVSINLKDDCCFVSSDECFDVTVKRERSYTTLAYLYSSFFEHVINLLDCILHASEINNTDFAFFFFTQNWSRKFITCSIDFILQSSHEVEIIIGLFRVNSIWVVASSTVENRSHSAPRKCSVWDSVSIEVSISAEVFHCFKDILFSNCLATVHWFVRVSKPFTSPAIHAKVKVRKSKHRSLVSLCNIKRSPAKFKAFFDSTWHNDNVLRITMTAFVKHG